MAKTLIWFSASWCKPCEQLAPIMESLATDYPYDKVMAEDNPEAFDKWNIRQLPTLVLVDSSIEIGRSIGLKSEKDLRNWIESCTLDAWRAENDGKPIVNIED